MELRKGFCIVFYATAPKGQGTHPKVVTPEIALATLMYFLSLYYKSHITQFIYKFNDST
jgi:hypothetical protein